MQTQAEVAGAFTPAAVVFLVGLIGGAAINLFIPILIWPDTWVRIVGLVPLAVGIGLFAWARAAFQRHRTSLMPWSPSTALVHDGPYAVSRNPIYLSFCIIYLGASLIFNSAYILGMLVVVIILFDRVQIPREERYLLSKFGEEFKTYKGKVRRWL